jgi:hypothetical protein
MDHETTIEAELNRLLERATASALATLNVRVDVPRRLQELHDRSTASPTDDRDENGEAAP